MMGTNGMLFRENPKFSVLQSYFDEKVGPTRFWSELFAFERYLDLLCGF